MIVYKYFSSLDVCVYILVLPIFFFFFFFFFLNMDIVGTSHNDNIVCNLISWNQNSLPMKFTAFHLLVAMLDYAIQLCI